jgi:hypothetical protein
MNIRQGYTDEQRAEAVRISELYGVPEAARRFRVTQTTIHNWKIRAECPDFDYRLTRQQLEDKASRVQRELETAYRQIEARDEIIEDLRDRLSRIADALRD